MTTNRSGSQAHTILIELAIVFSIVLSVFGALLLTQQEQAARTGSVPGSVGATEFQSATVVPMTPTPTGYASDIQHSPEPGPILTATAFPAAGSTGTPRPMTPTPTSVPPATTIGWSE